MIQLNDAQVGEVIAGKPVVVSEPDAGGDVIVLSAKYLDLVREAIAEKEAQELFVQSARVALRNWAEENPY